MSETSWFVLLRQSACEKEQLLDLNEGDAARNYNILTVLYLRRRNLYWSISRAWHVGVTLEVEWLKTSVRAGLDLKGASLRMQQAGKQQLAYNGDWTIIAILTLTLTTFGGVGGWGGCPLCMQNDQISFFCSKKKKKKDFTLRGFFFFSNSFQHVTKSVCTVWPRLALQKGIKNAAANESSWCQSAGLQIYSSSLALVMFCRHYQWPFLSSCLRSLRSCSSDWCYHSIKCPRTHIVGQFFFFFSVNVIFRFNPAGALHPVSERLHYCVPHCLFKGISSLAYGVLSHISSVFALLTAFRM